MKGLSKQEEDDLLEVSREAHSEEREAQADSRRKNEDGETKLED